VLEALLNGIIYKGDLTREEIKVTLKNAEDIIKKVEDNL